MTLIYQEYGDENNPLMLFIHGGGVSSWMWNKQLTYFKPYHCVTVDLPEHGLNKEANHFSILDSAKQILKYIEKKNHDKQVIVIGFSLGAQVLIQMLSLKPSLIDIAIINSALVKPSKISVKLIRPMINMSYPLIKYKWFAKLQAKQLYISDDHFDIYYKESSETNSNTLIRVLQENMSFQVPKQFAHATGKILVTVGEKERSIMKKSAIEIIQTNKHCTGVIIADVGHGAPLATPEVFNNMIENWVEGKDLPKECKFL